MSLHRSARDELHRLAGDEPASLGGSRFSSICLPLPVSFPLESRGNTLRQIGIIGLVCNLKFVIWISTGEVDPCH